MDLKQINVVLLGLAFHLIFFSFQTSVFVQQTVVNSLILEPNSQFHGNAYLSLCITYTVFALSNWLAPSIIALTGVKYGMILGACTYVLYSASFLFPTTWLYYTAAALIGFGAAPLWTAQGAFLSKQSDETNSSKNAALFWAMLQSSLLFGNLFVYFAFDDDQTKADDWPKHQIIATTTTSLPLVDGRVPAGRQSAKISDQTRYIVYGVLTLVCAIGTCVLLLLRDGTSAELANLRPNKGQQRHAASIDTASQLRANGTEDLERISALDQLLKAYKLSKTTNMLLLSTAFFFTGQLLSFFTGVYGTAIGATSQFGVDSKKFIGLAGIAIGIGEILGGAIFGLLGSRSWLSKLGRDTIFVLGFLVLSGALTLTFINLPPDSPLAKQSAQFAAIIEPRLWIAIVASVLIGFGDACFNTQVYSMLMSVYSQNSVPAFALFKFTQSVGSAVAFLYSTKLDLYFQIAILASMSSLATLCFCLVEWRTNAAIARERLSDSETTSPSSSVTNIKTGGGIEKSESQQSIMYRVD